MFEEWHIRAIGWRNSNIPGLSRELSLQYAHQCELVAEALESGQSKPKLYGFPKIHLLIDLDRV